MAYVLVTSLDGQESDRQKLPADTSNEAERLARAAANGYILGKGYSGRFHFTARTWTLTKPDQAEVVLKVVEVN